MIRALLIATLAEGTSYLKQPLYSQDTLSCIEACRKLGAEITREKDYLQVTGTGGYLTIPSEPIDVGNSGTSLYLITALASLASEQISFDGDEQIRNRSASNLLNALTDLGVTIQASTSSKGTQGCAPYSVRGPLNGGSTSIECPTSQYLSALLLAAPCAAENVCTEIKVPLLFEQPYVEITLDWLEKEHIKLERKDLHYFKIPGGQRYRPFNRVIPADYSSATFYFCAAAITGSTLTIGPLDREDPQGDKKVLDLLEEMGCTVEWNKDWVTVTGNSLKAITMDLNSIPDSLPAMAVTACFAQGESHITNVPQARIKETDRIALMTRELGKMGARIIEESDGMRIQGTRLKGAVLNGWDDHRLVMALSIAAAASEGESSISGAEASDVTFPGFFDVLGSLLPASALS